MKTQDALRRQIAPTVLEAIANGTAGPDLRAAYRLQILSAQNAPLLAADLAAQTDWVDPAPVERGGQVCMF